MRFKELAAAFLDYAKVTQGDADYKHCRAAIVEFLLKLYGDDTPADSFKPRMPFKTRCFVFSDIVLYGTTSSTKGVVYETP